MKKPDSFTADAAESLAIQALTYLAADGTRLERFLGMTGITPEGLRTAAAAPGFLGGVLDHVVSDETLLTGFAAQAGIDPAALMRARAALGHADWEREVP